MESIANGLTSMSDPQVVLLLTTIFGIIISLIKDSRNRRWLIEDNTIRATAAAEARKADLAEIVARARAEAEAVRVRAEATAAALAIETRATTEREAEKLRTLNTTHTQRIEGQLRDVQAAATTAYTEANHVNGKIETLSQQLAAQLDTAAQANARHEAQMQALKVQVGEVHSAAESAYTEANHVNIKIEDLNLRLIKQGEQTQQAATDTLDHNAHISEVVDIIDAASKEHTEQLTDIQRAVGSKDVKP